MLIRGAGHQVRVEGESENNGQVDDGVKYEGTAPRL